LLGGRAITLGSRWPDNYGDVGGVFFCYLLVGRCALLKKEPSPELIYCLVLLGRCLAGCFLLLGVVHGLNIIYY